MTGKYPRPFGKYVLLKPMAKGGMGEIFLAARGDLEGFEKLCVIKKVLTEKADRTKANRFLDEAKVVLRLSHAALVTTFDAGDVDGEFYIAMELVEGKDLREVWNRCVRTQQRIPLDVALHLVREVARALAYVHGYGELNLVHRDVAPPNILLAYVGDVKLTDFGLARSVLKQEHTVPGVVFGRAAYLAPEQARGEIADTRTDIHMLGIVLWELLTGRQYLQLAGLDPLAAMAVVRHPKLVPPSKLSPWIAPSLDRVVLKALAPDRDQRFASAEEMRVALGEVIAEVAPRADPARVAELLRLIYSETIAEERAEHDRFLKEVIPRFRALAAAAPGPGSPEPTAAPEARRPRAPGGPKTPDGTPDGTPVGPPGCRLGRVISEGRTGSLYQATRIDSGAEISVRLPARAPGNAAPLEKLRAEARKIADLRHPHIASCVELGVGPDGRLYQVLDPVTGTDLASLLRREPRLDAGRAVRIAVQVGRALGAAHAIGSVHGDLVPERVMVATGGQGGDRVTVLDLGLYGPSAGGASDDVHALGAMLYEMVTGTPPHASADPMARKRAPAPQSPRMFRPEIPVEIERAILTALESDPERRFASMAALEDALVAGERAWTEGARKPSGVAGRTPTVDSERRRARREAAFRAIAELAADTVSPLSVPPAPPRAPPADTAGPPRRAPQPAPPPAPSRAFGVAVLARYGAGPDQRGTWRRVRAPLALAAIALALAFVARLFRKTR